MSHTKSIVGLAVAILLASAFFVAAKDHTTIAAKDPATVDTARAAQVPTSETTLPESNYEYLPIDGIPYFSIRSLAGVPDPKQPGSR